MSNKSTIVLSILVIFIFSLGIFYFGINIAGDLKQNAYVAEKVFKNLVEQVETEKTSSVFLSEKYLNSIVDYAKNDQNIAALTLKGKENGKDVTYLVYPVNSRYFAGNGISGTIEVNNNAMRKFNHSMQNGVKNEFYIDAAIYLITPQKVFDYALFSLCIIAFGTLLALLCVLVCKKPAANAKSESKTETGDNHKENLSVATNENIKENAEKIENQEIKVSRKETSNNTSQQAQNDFVPQYANRRIDPLGLFSPATGLSWESYLENRLDAELVRAASSEQELALIYIRPVDVCHNHPCAKEIASVLIDCFGFRDLLFEFGDDGYICILQNCSVTKCLSICEHLYQNLANIVKNFGFDTPLVMGVSTRSMRLISGIRLVKEAMEAVNKALEEPELPIVAFKVNPERYRQFLNEEITRSAFYEGEQNEQQQ